MTPAFAIGPANVQDVTAMAAILTDWADDAPWLLPRPTLADNRAWCENLIAGQEVLAARAPAFLGFLARDGETVSALYLAPLARRRGVGAALVKAARAGRSRLEVWTWGANAAALAFWQAQGFRIVATTEGGEDAGGMPDLNLEWRRGPGP